jgi:anti-sigma regulatory factor (Ser/Thr protein kinase)
VVTDGFVSITLESTPEAPSIARRFAARAAHELDEDQADALRLLVSEAVSDAVEHHAAWVHVGVEPAKSRTRVEITDSPHEAEVDPSFGHGYGRRLLDSLAERWGTAPEGDGRRLWFELRTG